MKRLLNYFPELFLTTVGGLLLVAFTYALREQDKYLTGPNSFIIYYILPATIAALCLGSLFLTRKTRINITLAISSVAVTLYLVETALYSLYGNVFSTQIKKENARAARALGITVDTRDKVQVIDDLRGRGINAYPAYSATFASYISDTLPGKTGHELLALGGISNKTTVLCNESGIWAIYESDEHGFRNPKGLYTPDMVDVAAVGDSYTHGSCVSDEETIFTHLRNRYEKTLNFGLANSGPLSELAILREYIGPFRANIVLWFYYEGNDIRDLRRERREPLLMRYLDSQYTQNLSERQSEIDEFHIATFEQARQKYQSPGPYLYILKLTNLRNRLGLMYTQVDKVILESDLELLGDVLGAAREAVESWGGRLYLVYLPEWQRFNSPSGATAGREQVLALAERLDLPVIDIYEALIAQAKPKSFYPYEMHNHFNGAGYRLVADTISEQLEKALRQ